MIKKIGDVFRTIFWIMSVIGMLIGLSMPDWYMDRVITKTVELTKKMMNEEG